MGITGVVFACIVASANPGSVCTQESASWHVNSKPGIFESVDVCVAKSKELITGLLIPNKDNLPGLEAKQPVVFAFDCLEDK